MNIGGNAFNNGIHFVSDKYRVKVERTAEGYEVKVTEVLSRKKGNAGKIVTALSKIPLVRGPLALVENSRIFGIVFLIALSFDLFTAFSPWGKSGSGILYDTVYFAYGLISIIILAYLVKKLFVRGMDTLRFHGAEHKVIAAFESGDALTFENVRKAPRIARRCGTELAVFALIFYAVFSTFINLSSLAMLLAFSFGYEVFHLEKGDKLPVISWLFKLGYFFQKHLFTREPTDEQLEAAIRAVTLLKEKEAISKKKEKTSNLN